MFPDRAKLNQDRLDTPVLDRILDRLEEWIIVVLMGAATIVTFVAVVHRYGATPRTMTCHDLSMIWLFVPPELPKTDRVLEIGQNPPQIRWFLLVGICLR